jgi:putative membrane protein
MASAGRRACRGDEIEDPFGLAANHLPLDALWREVEIHLLEALGETALPAPPRPQEFRLS